ncbi:ubiquinol-cytochrome c reductase iron-sulfur subunit [Streptomyces sp. NPDC058220]|uniref:QcrA and Rieske domain-containing protein n=1 Tax=unclassified Streptomyces TaxID=2593676 RepID=UPI00366817C3
MDGGTVRRTVLAAGAVALVPGCGGNGDGSGDGSGNSGRRPPQPSGPPAGSPAVKTAPPSAGSPAQSPAPLARTSDIPVGGGKIFADRKVVVTQPTEGEFMAFSAICTHVGCTVANVEEGTIDCPCHGARFSVMDAGVVAGPAPRPLPAREITVSGDRIFLA